VAQVNGPRAKATPMRQRTTQRLCLPAWASTLRMEVGAAGMRTLVTAALRSAWASEITSLTPQSPRRAS